MPPDCPAAEAPQGESPGLQTRNRQILDGLAGGWSAGCAHPTWKVLGKRLGKGPDTRQRPAFTWHCLFFRQFEMCKKMLKNLTKTGDTDMLYTPHGHRP